MSTVQNVSSIAADPAVNNLAALPISSTPTPVVNNAEYNTFQSLATVAPVPTVSLPIAVAPAAPYTTQLSDGTTVAGAPSPAAGLGTPIAYQPPAASQSPTSLASTPDPSTTASPSSDDLLASLLASIAGGQNATLAGSGGGVGSSDTSLPAPSAADVAALQPTPDATSSSGPNIVLIVGLILVAGIGVYFYIQHKKGH